MDPFEEFEFKPLTEGLGFHKKAEQLKQDVKNSDLAEERVSRSVPPAPPKTILKNNASAPAAPAKNGAAEEETVAVEDLGVDVNGPRPASKSISELIAALPANLDFLDDKPDAAPPITGTGTSKILDRSSKAKAGKGGETTRPQIFQPVGREEYAPTAKGSSKPPSPSKLAAKAAAAFDAPMGKPASVPAAAAPAPTAPAAAARSATLPMPGTPAAATLKGAPAAAASATQADLGRAFPHLEKAKEEITIEETETFELHAVAANPAAALLDGMVVLGVSSLFLVSVLMITKIDIVGLLTHSATDLPTQLHLGFLFVAILQIYMLSARSFFGATLGEWAFDMQVGTQEQQMKAVYPLQVLWRSLFMTVTGLVLVPLISLLAKRDLASYVTGLHLYEQKK